MKKSVIYSVVACLGFIAVALFIWTTYRNFPLVGELIIALPTENQRQITRLGPEPRVRITSTNQAILESPVYFDIRVLPWFHTANIEMVFQENGQTLDGIALQSAAGWNYNLKKPDTIEALADGWSKATFIFNLAGGYQVRNVRRFLLSTRHSDPSVRGEMLIQSLHVTLRW